ncbi:MAG: hypothetical protein ACQEQO_05025 [Thermodesulfobacteriota bacterium]
MADNAIRSGACETALVRGVERLSAILNWQDRSTCVLLGDGAGAVVVTSMREKGRVHPSEIRRSIVGIAVFFIWETVHPQDLASFRHKAISDKHGWQPPF